MARRRGKHEMTYKALLHLIVHERERRKHFCYFLRIKTFVGYGREVS